MSKELSQEEIDNLLKSIGIATKLDKDIPDEVDRLKFYKEIIEELIDELSEDEIHYHQEDFNPSERFSDSCEDAYYAGLADGRSDLAQEILDKIDKFENN
jgi:hypothetical protein